MLVVSPDSRGGLESFCFSGVSYIFRAVASWSVSVIAIGGGAMLDTARA